MKWIGAAALTLGVSLLAGCAAPSAIDSSRSDPDQTIVENHRLVYIESWDTDDVYARISQLPLAADTDLAIAFAVPTVDGGVTPPNVSEGLRTVVGRLDPNAGIALAVGGWGGTDAEHQDILLGFAAAARNPDAFSAEVARTAQQTGAELGRTVTGIDIDWEYPTAGQAQDFAAVAVALRKALPEARITAAVPAGHDLEGIQTALPAVRDAIDGFHVMTYDENTPFSGPGSTAGPVATEQGMLSAFRQWQAALSTAGIDPSKAALGIPTYCYAYTGVTAAGQPSQGGTQMPYVEVENQNLTSQADGSSAGVVNGAWTTCLTPDDARQIVAAAPPGTNLFYWSAEGMTPAYLTIGRGSPPG